MKFLKNILLASLCLATPAFAISGEELAKRQCRSVHTSYLPHSADTQAAYAEITVQKSSPGTYFCALGFHMGYIGMQELSNGSKTVIFSVWEPNHGQIEANVPESERARLIRKGEGVRTGRFGHEGTGGQSFFKYDWTIGEKVKFFVRAKKLSKKLTSYTGYFYDNKAKKWQLMTEFQTIAKDKMLGTGLYSFVEDFKRNYKSSKIQRSAHYTNIWSLGNTGTWASHPKARFTADPTPSNHVDAGAVENGYFLTTGGDTEMKTTKLWGAISSKLEEQIDLKTLPAEK